MKTQYLGIFISYLLTLQQSFRTALSQNMEWNRLYSLRRRYLRKKRFTADMIPAIMLV